MNKFKSLGDEIEHLKKLLEPEPSYIDKAIKRNIMQYIFYDKKKDTVSCSNCGKISDIKHVIRKTKEIVNNLDADIEPLSEMKHKAYPFFCPHCGRDVEARAAGMGRGVLELPFRISYWMKRGKTLYLITKLVDVDFYDGVPNIRKRFRAIYVFGKDGPRKFICTWDYIFGGSWSEKKTFSYYRERSINWYSYPKYGIEMYYDSKLQNLLEGSYLQYAADENGWCHNIAEMSEMDWTEYTKGFIDCEYLGLFNQYPAVEVLHKTGFDYLIEQRIRGQAPLSALNWKETKLQKIFRGLNMKEIRKIRENEYPMNIIKDIQNAKKKGLNVRVAAVVNVINYRTGSLNAFEEKVGAANLEKTLRYLENGKHRAIEYLDYYNQCRELQYDLDDKKIRYPKDLTAAHRKASIALEELREKQREEKEKENVLKFQQRVQDAFPKDYSWTGDGLMIRPALSPEELRKEGNAMHHCVGGYDTRVVSGECFIIFIRKQDEPDKSFVTMECTPEFEMIQIRARANRNPAPEVRATAEEWLNEYKKNQKKLLKENGKETA